MMDYQEFKDEIKDNIKAFLPEEFADSKVEINEVIKNNDTKLDAVTILSPDSNISPTIYLNDFYKQYENGRDMEDIMTQIAEIRVSNEVNQTMDVSHVMDFDMVKDSIVPRLVNAEMNEELLKNRPHTEVSDLAVIYAVVVESDERGLASIPITNQMMESYGVTTEELHETAVANMEEKSPSKFASLMDIIKEKAVSGIMQDMEVDKEAAEEMFESMMPAEETPMYVISNEQGINGASSILDEKLMDQVAERVGDDFFVLPSSIHECIVIPNDGRMELEALEQMVQEVNETQVLPQERLSDHVYTYNAQSHELTRADRSEEISQNIDGKVQEETAYDAATKDDSPFVDGADVTEVSSEPKEYEKIEEVTMKFGKGLVGEPFQGKDGNEYCEIKIPNRDEADKSPWASFVVKSNQVHEDKFGKGMWTKLPAEGSTTVKKPEIIGQDENGKNQYQDTMTKVPNKELKSMVEAYKERPRENQMETVTIKCAKGVVGEPFQGKDGNEYRQVKIPNRDEADKSPWATFVVKSNQIHEDKFGKGMFMKLPAEGSTTVRKDEPTTEKDGKMQYETKTTKVPNKELKEMVEFYKDRDQSKEQPQQAPKKEEQKAPEKEEKEAPAKAEKKSPRKTKEKEQSSLSERISKKKEQSQEKQQEKPKKEQTKKKEQAI